MINFITNKINMFKIRILIKRKMNKTKILN